MSAMLAVTAASAAADDGREWIKRMNEALATRNYEGVLKREIGQRKIVLTIVHRVQNGVMAERVAIISPEGPGARVFTRKGARWIAYDPAKQEAQMQTRNRNYGYIVAFNGLNADSARYYAIANGGSTDFEGRPAQRISMEPVDDLRYGYRFWLDVKTGLPLKTQVVTRSGRVVETLSFVTVAFPDRIDDEQLKPGFDAAHFHWMNGDVPMYTPGMTKVFVPRTELMPAGFSVRLFTNPAEEAKAPGPRTRFIVSDGIAWVSVFVDRMSRPAPNSGLGYVMGPKDRIHAERSARDGMGSTAFHVVERDGFLVTVVGEVPLATVKAIAEAVRSD